LRVYKVCTGKNPNEFAFDGECRGKKYATEIVLETHEFWKQLRDDKKDVVSTPLPM
jgi:inorganic pyrophosphatase